MTRFLHDILRQPGELQRALEYLSGEGRPALERAAAAVKTARHVYLTGIGSSWHAALCAGPLFHAGGRPVYLLDASELLEFSSLPPDSLIIVISRSGRSVEIVKLLSKANHSGAIVIGITNSKDSALGLESQIPIVISVPFDHGISVNTYSTLALAAGVLARANVGAFDAALATSLSQSFVRSSQALAGWQEQVENSRWLAPGSVTYFLARGSSLGSCYEARLLWEEGVKSAATAMGTGSFRHGPQEIVRKGTRFGIWIDERHMREQDLSVARDLSSLGASVMLVGQNLPADAAELEFQLPAVQPDWQFLIDIIPPQLLAEKLSRLSGTDCDSFRLCSYVVEDEYGLLHGKPGTSENGL
jgi:glutamine---fructose-6-phosphate transaminase (isomerizing)